MAGRGGRGAAIMEAIKAKQREQQQREVGGGDAGRLVPAEGSAPPLTTPAGRGRAALLATLAQKKESSEQTVGGQAVVTDPPRPAGRGRAQLLQALSQGGLPESVTSKPGSSAQPSPERIRDVGAVTKQISQISLQEKPAVHRTGESGKKFQATANYIKLNLEPGKGVYEYEVKFNPEIDSRNIRYKLLHQHNEVFGGVKTFDGGNVLYLPVKLHQEVATLNSIHPTDNTTCTLSVIFKKQKRLGECIHMYNVLFRRIMNELEHVVIGRQHYTPVGAHQIPQHKLEVWPGYVTAVDEYEGGIQLCCDASHRVLRTQTVLEVMDDIAQRNPNTYRDMVQKNVIGTCVLTRYNNRTYRVDDIDWAKNPRSSFSTHSGDEITFQQYYQKQYGLQIHDPGQPLLVSRVKKKIRGKDEQEELVCLIPELCFMTGLTDAMRSDFTIMKDIAMYTRITPNQRQNALRKFIQNVQSNEKARGLLAGWGLSLDRSTVALMGRVMDPEAIYFGNGASVRGTPQADWSRDTMNNNVLTAVDLNNWLVIHTSRDTSTANNFMAMMEKVGSPMGMQIYRGKNQSLRDDRTDSYLRALRENINPSLQLVVIIFPTSRDDRYSAVKKLCCSDMPIASQVIISRTLARPDRMRAIVQKVALQINCKLGGTLWAVKIPLEGCMVCGIDSYHEAGRRGSSVAAFVASQNQNLTRWFSRVAFQGPGQELVDGLKTCLIAALQAYHKENSKFPDRIVIYRDGVGDGQLNVSAEYEVPQFQTCFQHIFSGYNPKLTVVVCQKRINTRIFASLRGGGDSDLANPTPGSVIDHTITRRNWYDFFLVSQHVRQGTVTPTHYVVIHDSCNMKTDHLQRLTYKLCHLYYNWPGTIRVPAPCQYAHKLAQLVGQSIRREPSEKLQDKLYFL